ncbi:MAG: hypothetical protein J6R30_05670 [Bacteroidales bacterium]|nr:hypothetical protein [Bacteroidales bacterium]
MKYYIPTTSLNIDNILSTESISPYSFYAQRKFGSRNFDRIPGRQFDQALLLYSQPPYFEINDTEYEQYPIILEFDDDIQLQTAVVDTAYSNEELQIAACYQTLYLTPWNTRILCFNRKAYDSSRLIIESSRNCKLGSKFVWQVVSSNYHLDKMIELVSEDCPASVINTDYAINTAKGATWGLIIGAQRSISPSSAALKAISNSMRNIVSNAISNSGVCAPNFYAQLIDLDKQYRTISDAKANELWNKECTNEIHLILEKFNVLQEAYIKFIRTNNLSIAPAIPAANTTKDQWITYRDRLTSYTEAYIYQSNLAHRQQYNLGDINFIDNSLHFTNAELVNSVLDLICKGAICKEDLRINRDSVVKNVLSVASVILKSKIGEAEWASTLPERQYINAIFKNVSDFEPFNLNSIDNIELQSIAAFLLKGEDWDALVRYVEDNAMADLRYVMALWGALEGYSSIHKKLVTPLADPSTIVQVLSIFGIHVNTNEFPIQPSLPLPSLPSHYKTSDGSSTSGEVVGSNNEVKEESIIGNIIGGMKKLITGNTSDITPDNTKDAAAPSDPHYLTKLFRSEPFMALSEKGQKWYIEHATELCYAHKDLSDDLHNQLCNLRDLCPISGTKTKWDKALKCIEPAKTAKTKKTKSTKSAKARTENSDNLLFAESENEVVDSEGIPPVIQETDIAQQVDNVVNHEINIITTENRFVNHSDVVIEIIFSYTESLGKEIQTKILKSYKEICKGYAPGGFYTKRGDNHTNRDTIEHFIRYCTSKKNHFCGVTWNEQVGTILKKLQDKLFELYGCTNN